MIPRPQEPMKEAVLEYQRTGTGRRELLDRVGAHVYRFPLWRSRREADDDCGEFYLFCRPRLEELIARFQDRGRPFEYYLNSVLAWQLRSYYRSKGRQEAAWRLAGTPPFWDPQTAALPSAPPPAHRPRAMAPDPPTVAAASGGGASRRRLLFAFLKNCHRLHDAQVTAWAELFHRPDLPALILRARRAGADSERRWRRLHERSNRAFSAARLLEGQLLAEPEGDRQRLLCTRLQRVRRTAANAQAELRVVRLGPSNRQIAQLLGIPKGTVDTGLFWLKHRLPHSTPSCSRVRAS